MFFTDGSLKMFEILKIFFDISWTQPFRCSNAALTPNKSKKEVNLTLKMGNVSISKQISFCLGLSSKQQYNYIPQKRYCFHVRFRSMLTHLKRRGQCPFKSTSYVPWE